MQTLFIFFALIYCAYSIDVEDLKYDKVKILDPSLNMGRTICNDHGQNVFGCNLVNYVKPVCILHPVDNDSTKNYHYHCTWKSLDKFNLKVTVSAPYNDINVDMYPISDLTSFEIFVSFLLIMCVYCTISNISDGFFAGYAGGILANSWNNVSTCYSSGYC